MGGESVDHQFPAMDGLQSSLLRWAVENMENKDTAAAVEGQEGAHAQTEGMNPVRKEEAMKNIQDLGPEWYDALFGKSDVEVMKELLKVLERYVANPAGSGVSVEDVLTSLEQIGFLVELTHNANDLPKIGGLPVLVKLLNDTNEDVRVQVCLIIGKSASNNPEYQQKILNTDVLPRLIKMLNGDSSKVVHGKALYAVSGIVRHCEPALEVFSANAGFVELASMLDNEPDRNIQARIVFFMTYCLGVDSSGSLAQLLLNDGKVTALLLLLQERDFDLREKILTMLLELSRVGGDMYKAVMKSLGAKKLFKALLLDEKEWMKQEPDQDHFDTVEMVKQLLVSMK